MNPEPRYAPDAPARRALDKLLSSAQADDRMNEDALRLIEIYATIAYQKGRERGRREGGRNQ